ncbi:MAG: GTP-binding protein, partial [bacterium]|nr:GTP-binding protein [bacterium]
MLQPKPPVVAILGHVDHGKTTLLDYIRKSDVAGREFGGITQRISACQIGKGKDKITFIDTPGHEIFSKMRQKGASLTDIAVLVVSATDGVMPQTKESLEYIKSSGVPLIVAINKIDLPEANIAKVESQLGEAGVVFEKFGGEAICVPVSAKTGKGVDKLLETILTLAEIHELKADPDA